MRVTIITFFAILAFSGALVVARTGEARLAVNFDADGYFLQPLDSSYPQLRLAPERLPHGHFEGVLGWHGDTVLILHANDVLAVDRNGRGVRTLFAFQTDHIPRAELLPGNDALMVWGAQAAIIDLDSGGQIAELPMPLSIRYGPLAVGDSLAAVFVNDNGQAIGLYGKDGIEVIFEGAPDVRIVRGSTDGVRPMLFTQASPNATLHNYYAYFPAESETRYLGAVRGGVPSSYINVDGSPRHVLWEDDEWLVLRTAIANHEVSINWLRLDGSQQVEQWRGNVRSANEHAVVVSPDAQHLAWMDLDTNALMVSDMRPDAEPRMVRHILPETRLFWVDNDHVRVLLEGLEQVPGRETIMHSDDIHLMQGIERDFDPPRAADINIHSGQTLYLQQYPQSAMIWTANQTRITPTGYYRASETDDGRPYLLPLPPDPFYTTPDADGRYAWLAGDGIIRVNNANGSTAHLFALPAPPSDQRVWGLRRGPHGLLFSMNGGSAAVNWDGSGYRCAFLSLTHGTEVGVSEPFPFEAPLAPAMMPIGVLGLLLTAAWPRPDHRHQATYIPRQKHHARAIDFSG